MNRHVAFDLEIVKELPNGGNWEPYRPFGISIISTCTENWLFKTWPTPESMCYNGTEKRYPSQLRAYGSIPAAHYLLDCADAGIPIITINGLGFDFRVLVEELEDLTTATLQRELAQLACSNMHIDIGFAMVCNLGFMCGMQAMCEGFGLPGKSEGITGKLIPTLWKGTLADQEKCLEYCRNDVAMTSLVYQAIMQHGLLRYKTKRGNMSVWEPNDINALDVVSVQKLPEVVKPFWPRSKFTDWLGKYL